MGWRDADITGVQSPPLPGVDHPSWDGLAGKGPGIRENRFSRRDALCASANTDRMRTESCRGYRR